MEKDRYNKVRNVQLLHFWRGWRRIVTTKYGMCNCCIFGGDGEGSSQQSTECAIAAFLEVMEKDRHNKVRNVQLLHFWRGWRRIVTTKYGMCNCCIFGGDGEGSSQQSTECAIAAFLEVMEKDRHNKVRNVQLLHFWRGWRRIVTTKYGMCNCCIFGGDGEGSSQQSTECAIAAFLEVMEKDRHNKVRNVQLLHFWRGWRRIVTTKYGMCNCCIFGGDGEGSSQQSTECAIAAFLEVMEKDRHNKVRNVQLLHFWRGWRRIVTTKYGMCNCCIFGGDGEGSSQQSTECAIAAFLEGMEKDRHNKVRNVQLLHFWRGWRRIVTTKYGMCNCCIFGGDGEGSSQQSTECAIAAFLEGMEKDRHNKVRNVQLLHFWRGWRRIVTTK